jgi:hypothetical protein
VWQRLCQYRLTQDDIKKFMDAIDEDYVFEMYIDGLPVVGFVGDTEKIVEQYADHHHNTTRYFLYTHLAFSIAYHSVHPHDGGYVCGVIINMPVYLMLILDHCCQYHNQQSSKG